MARNKGPSVRREAGPLRVPYEALKKLTKKGDYVGVELAALIMDLVRVSLTYLQEKATPIALISKVPEKDYFSFALKSVPDKLSSPINRALFNPDFAKIQANWTAWEVGKPTSELPTLIYTMGSRSPV